MHVYSFFGLNFIDFNWWCFLIFSCCWLLLLLRQAGVLLYQIFRFYTMVLNNFIPLDFAIGYLLWLFKVVMFFLFSKEALNLMVLKSKGLPSYLRQVVDEANHGSCALWVKFIVVSRFDLGPLISTFFLRLLVRVLSDAVLDVIAEICHEAHAIV